MRLAEASRHVKRRAQAYWSRRQPAAIILMYHRISTVAPEPNWLAVSPSHLVEQLAYIRAKLNPMSLADLAAAVARRSVPPRSVAVTFDDGYHDNLSQALPRLEAANMPATVFVTTGFIDANEEFWWDELSKFLLESGTGEPTLSLPLPGRSYSWPTTSPADRRRAYTELKELLKPLSREAKSNVMGRLATWSGMSRTPRADYRTMTTSELRSLARSDCIDVGAHTVTHPILPSLPIGEQQREIAESRRTLESLLQKPVETFAYPNGDFAADTLAAVGAAGFKTACTTRPGVITGGEDPLVLPRCAVNDYGVDTFAEKVAEWFGWKR